MKSIAEISAWVLFVFAWIMLINVIVQSWFYDLGTQWTMVGVAIAMVSFFLTVAAARLRHNME